MKFFLAVQGVLYIAIVLSDIGNYLTADWSNVIKLFSVVVCFMYLLLTFRPRISGFDHLLMIGVISVTILADAILLFSDQLLMGVLVFIGVQILYAYRIACFGQLKIRYAPYIGMIVAIAAFSFIINDKSLLMVAVLFYGVLFVVNLKHLILIRDQNLQKHTLFTIGFILFLICDINVLFFNILKYYGISNLFYEFTRVSMWLFYLPAQVLLSLSAVKEKKEQRIR